MVIQAVPGHAVMQSTTQPDLIESAWEYQRADDDPRKIWYPG